MTKYSSERINNPLQFTPNVNVDASADIHIDAWKEYIVFHHSHENIGVNTGIDTRVKIQIGTGLIQTIKASMMTLCVNTASMTCMSHSMSHTVNKPFGMSRRNLKLTGIIGWRERFQMMYDC